MRTTTTLTFFLALALGPACDDATTGRRITLRTRVEADLPAQGVVTSMGWTVTLTKAVVSMGALYYHEGRPPALAAAPPAGWRRWTSLAIGTAHAHPGHYTPGQARGQMLVPTVVDLLAGPATLPDGDGTTGVVRSATFSFAAPAGPLAGAPGDRVVLTEGTARKDGTTVHFVLGATLAELARSARDGQIAGCVFAETEVAGDGQVTVTVRPRAWFNLVDFAALAPGTPAAPTVVAPDETARVAFALGLGQASAYLFAFQP